MNKFPDGVIVQYPYLWRWQAEKGREQGEKERPVCLAMTILDTNNLTHLVILPISGTRPYEGQVALVIPPLEIRRAGLSSFKQGWITVSEYNYDILERSFNFDPSQKPLGQFSPRFLEDIRQAFLPTLRSRQSKVDRLD